ncbi:MAG TPA: hypothetical protein VK203_13850, partial [Nostocaceae cyanobacterium]|nr:hypothetical protein [Nostocaceae cyanobacterium]
MYKPPQQRSQSRIPTTAPKTSHNQHATGSFGVQPQLDHSQTPPETQKYSPELADLLAAKMTSTTRQPAPQALPIQTKLTVGAPGDKYEQEADSMASKVMSMSDSAVQRQTALGTQIQPQVQARFVQRAPDRNVLAEGNIENQLNSSQGGGS